MITRMTGFGLLMLAVVFGQGASSTEYGCPNGSDAQQLADDYNRRWLRAAGTGSAQQLAELYTDNAVLMPPTDETIVGRAPIGEYLTANDTGPRLSNYSVDIVACELAGDTLQFAGVWGATQADFRANEIVTGNVLRIVDRQADGSWATRYEIWN